VTSQAADFAPTNRPLNINFKTASAPDNNSRRRCWAVCTIYDIRTPSSRAGLMAQNMLPPGDPTAPDFDYSDLPKNFDCGLRCVKRDSIWQRCRGMCDKLKYFGAEIRREVPQAPK